jgi:hypothetical protein
MSLPELPTLTPPLSDLLLASTAGDKRLWRWSRIITIVAGVLSITWFIERHVAHDPLVEIEQSLEAIRKALPIRCRHDVSPDGEQPHQFG